MKHQTVRIFAAGLCLALLAGCAAPGAGGKIPAGTSSVSSGSAISGEGEKEQWRIVDGAGTDSLLLARQGEEGTVCTLSPANLTLTLDGSPAQAADLRDGMLVTVEYGGSILDIWPSKFESPTALAAFREGADDRCGLVLQVFEDLWNTDEGLNSGIARVGVDIDDALLPNAAERAAVAWRFAGLHGLEGVQGSWQELAEQGYIQEKGLVWEDGCLFSFRAAEGQEQTEKSLRFNAQKWRAGDGAYFFQDCTATADREGDGGWAYQVGSEAIA